MKHSIRNDRHLLATSIIILFVFLFSLIPGKMIFAQPLQPGFDKGEYMEMLRIAARQVDRPWDEIKSPLPSEFKLEYRSQVMGLSNQWDLWSGKDRQAVLAIRGTTKEMISWIANFYAAMVPASGAIQPDYDFVFNYHLADDPKAAVHAGWLVATAFLARDMMPKIDSLYAAGTKNLIIMGHSQGGAIAFMLTSHLYHLRETGRIPADVIFKTYCSAAPKPGNLYYAYEYENMTREGWGFNVVNASDWVPEMPISIQTIHDYNDVNPFIYAGSAIKRHKPWWQRLILRKIYKKLSKPPMKSQQEYQKVLGDKLYEQIKVQLPGFVKPEYVESSNFVRTGKTIVLIPDREYRNRYPDNAKNVFMHHYFDNYLFLTDRYREK